jgi:protein involved in polysaccharide export with SLBB domain
MPKHPCFLATVLLITGTLAFAQTGGGNRSGNQSSSSSPPLGGSTNSNNNSNNSSSTISVTPGSAPTPTDPNYKLSPGDSIVVVVTNQNDMSASETLGRSGELRLPMIKEEVFLSGKTVREAEYYLEGLYKEKKLLKRPVVGVKVSSYAPREVAVLGAVRSPGTIGFSRDTTSMDVVDIITKAGGFLPIAKTDAVVITHRNSDGKEVSRTVDLENVITGRRRLGKDRMDEPIYPGDRIFVPERLF